ncbi:MAG TPA: LPS assembly lipoprotein LptE [Pseudothauera hydrothermalis]|nr:LPS assembly lipoprotein LptE [Pseudothauera hydrothermalis]
MVQHSRRRLLTAASTLAVSSLLAGCGFRLRGPQPLAFATIYLGTSQNSGLGAQLARHIRATGSTEVVADPAQAEVSLQILRDGVSREILSLTGAGKVREYQLTRDFVFQLVGRDGALLVPPTQLTAQRDYTFQDERILAKEQEESLLLADMQNEIVRQLVRRLAAVRK